MSISSIWPIDRTLSGTTNPGRSEPESYGNKRVFCIPQSSGITRASLSDCLVSYPGHSLGKILPLCRDAVCVFFSPSWLGYHFFFAQFKCQTVLFNFSGATTLVREDLGAMAMKGYSTFPKAPRQESHYQIVVGGSIPRKRCSRHILRLHVAVSVLFHGCTT